ncbi:MAG: bifunctional 2-C-methyl-D-erythritol 4-phosphate cytidylyltransferase/2-C-methyl-D-erythritol 2,4-cyclodiphosphate synthase [Alphaproteobacteria bacterium]|nr:bifunctional 2-C-methyl-D-erythritol 4-phosphate cytidylyltransferase/2-C-methyl-D-erythritol 2,4-cyclodiphosphate synthase [Alphaproteobacteria bacterium]
MRIYALVLAAGRGLRFGADRPKQYLPLGGLPLIRHSLALLARDRRIAGVAAVIGPEDGAAFAAAAEGLALLPPIIGGATRQASALAGLEALATLLPAPPDAVLIHDAARPFLSAALLGRLVDALAEAPGAIPALPVADTIKRADAGMHVAGTLSRAGLYRVQTPQAFRFAPILAAHRAAASLPAEVAALLTDDAAVAELAGLAVALVPGEEANMKITGPEDLPRAEARLAGLAGQMLPAVGTGFDVHRFAPDRPLVLCGVRVPHPLGLAGHSDADVGLHALCDAIYGALAEGDIGRHFPPSEAAWKDADSARFLVHAGERVAARGGRIASLDVTLICERPKIAPHADAMRARIAAILGIAASRVSVKATPTERLGFTGRGEGIAAQAVATLLLPEAETPL